MINKKYVVSKEEDAQHYMHKNLEGPEQEFVKEWLITLAHKGQVLTFWETHTIWKNLHDVDVY